MTEMQAQVGRLVSDDPAVERGRLQSALATLRRDVDTLINSNPQAFPQRPATPGTTGQR